MNEEQLRKLHEVFNDCWKFAKKWNSPKSEDEWKQMLQEAEELHQKDKDSTLRKRLISETILVLKQTLGKKLKTN